jgi:hypothetical protein
VRAGVDTAEFFFLFLDNLRRKYLVLARLGGATLRARHAGAAQTPTRLSEA